MFLEFLPSWFRRPLRFLTENSGSVLEGNLNHGATAVTQREKSSPSLSCFFLRKTPWATVVALATRVSSPPIFAPLAP